MTFLSELKQTAERIQKYKWTLVIAYTDGNVLRLPFEDRQKAIDFAQFDGDHVRSYYIEPIE